MDAEALKIILKLQEENTLFRRAINEAIIALAARKKTFSLDYGDTDISWMFRNLFEVLDELESAKQSGHAETIDPQTASAMQDVVGEQTNKEPIDKAREFRRELILAFLQNPNANPHYINEFFDRLAESLRLMEPPNAEGRKDPSPETQKALDAEMSCLGIPH